MISPFWKTVVERMHKENEFVFRENGYDNSVATMIETFKGIIDGKIETMSYMQSEAITYDEFQTEDTTSNDSVPTRSIFNDIDE